MTVPMRYGSENFDSFPDNTQGLIKASDMRSLVASAVQGGVSVIEETAFTVPIANGVPVSINPLLPSPTVAGVLWTTDGNHRALPNYSVAMPTVSIPAGYSKFVEVDFTLAGEKAGSGEDQYLFQLDNDGTPVGIGLTVTLGTEPTVFSLGANELADISGPTVVLLGLTVTGLGTNDDIDLSVFEMSVEDNQIWAAI